MDENSQVPPKETPTDGAGGLPPQQNTAANNPTVASSPAAIPPQPTPETTTQPPSATPLGAPSTQQSAPKKPWASKKNLIAVAIVCAVLVAAGAIFWLTRDSSQNSSTEPTTGSAQKAPRLALGAALTYAEGTVERSSGDTWDSAEEGATLGEGDELRTGQDSRAIITLDDGSAIRLNQNSKVTLDTLLSDSVIVINNEGAVYTRVVTAEDRMFDVKVADTSYTALGTAYMTTNTADKKGVEVFHSQVKTGDKTVKEGQGLYKIVNGEKANEVVSLDPEKLRQNTFITWNKAQDEKNDEFKEKLGFLKDIDKTPEPQQPTPPQPPQQPSDPGASISASASSTNDGINVSWSLNGVSSNYAYKVVYSTSDTTPTYGENSAQYVPKGNYSTKLKLTDGKTWNIRVCSYRGNGQCLYYSNTVTVQAPYVEKEKVTRGTMSASLSGSVISWSYSGNAPYGYKVVWNTSGAPTYPPSGSNAGARLVTPGNSLDLNSKIQASGTYKVRVCAYTSHTESDPCVDYSAEQTFTRP
ncbi:hypothetical protein CR970_01995 [Candidatus Saccharibacteria bacterium]|nr:MAG: hypothetical protein CR970_01995 [Candidatus Saccharibacteria bacterium]